MNKNTEYLNFLIIGICAVLIVYFLPFAIPDKVSSAINDIPCQFNYFFLNKSVRPLKIIGITIDEYSLNKIQQRWPWRRSVYARLIKLLDNERVDTVGLDLVLAGESDIKEDDKALTSVLKGVKNKIVLASIFDYKAGLPVLPFKDFIEGSYAVGMVDTPVDKDGKIRRLRSLIEFEDRKFYSFTVQLSSAFLKRDPDKIIRRIPCLKDRTFFINYALKPKDIIKVSFYDVLNNLEALKEEYGSGFLEGSLVLVYPEAEVIHDILLTPFGYMPGGVVNINGAANIISGRFIRESRLLSIPFLVISFSLILYFLQHVGFIQGLLLTCGIFAANLWLVVLISLRGIKFDYSQTVIFGLLFFSAGSLYKYIYFLSQLLRIKDKATLDPLRGLFTLRYFYYRFELELKKRYLRKDLFLVFIYFESLKDELEGMPLEQVKDIWQGLRPVISLKASFWSVYSPDELVGCLTANAARMAEVASYLKNNLEALLRERNIKSQAKIGYLRFSRKYPLKELVHVLSTELKKTTGAAFLFREDELPNLSSLTYPGMQERGKFLDVLSEDIEEKNRQLLQLIDNLNREHLKSKEAFFQIIISLVNALEARDPYTEGHSRRVANYALKVAEKLGWPNEEKEKLKRASLLHDIGKIGIPDSVLHKKDRLSDEEYDFIKKHEVIGIRILEPLKEMKEILPWILYHHERWDGKGYPHGLAGDAIPLAAQIISIADVFDALTTGRDYKGAFSHEDSMKEIVKARGTQFSPQLVDTFVSLHF